METKEFNDLLSFIAGTVFDICHGVLIDTKEIDYYLSNVQNKEIREHAMDILNRTKACKYNVCKSN